LAVSIPIRGLYAITRHPFPDFEELERRGLTHLFFAESDLIRDLPTSILKVKEAVNAIKNTDIELHVDIHCFNDEHYNRVDPKDIIYRDMTIQHILSLLENVPEIRGISFDDYHCPYPMYKTQDATVLNDYAISVKNAVKDYDSSIQLSAAIAQLVSTIPVLQGTFDFVLHETYRNDVYTTNIRSSVKESVRRSNGNPNVVDLITFNGDLSKRDVCEIMVDLRNTLLENVEGYAFYAWPYCSPDIYFPDLRVKMVSPNLFVKSL
jgi:hypothetical protein